MRGQSEELASLEEYCMAGACPRRPQRFCLFRRARSPRRATPGGSRRGFRRPGRDLLFWRGDFAACGRRVSFPAMGKKPKDRRGTAQDGHSVSIFALPIPSGLRPSPLDKGSRPPVPHYGGRVPARLCKISGAQNLSGDLRFLPGHWALASPKFQSVRFLFHAWLYRANAPSAHTAVGATLAVALSLPL